jgi:hypothetical protein
MLPAGMIRFRVNYRVAIQAMEPHEIPFLRLHGHTLRW